ncbi:hypothetical protein EVAR_4095_1 [Eumeta japonica]|uniref:Pre-C2HC domain-containing protein n=1 Tax=Eumeta variegata TaxID=151549 RepID=A0A4C1T7J3_EUMVA|nr:hypothetical protein EVAR_4095_1 [Eumeta japonica]
MDSKRLKAFLSERKHLDPLRNFEMYCSSLAFPDLPDSASDSDIEFKFNPSKEPTNGQPPFARRRISILIMGGVIFPTITRTLFQSNVGKLPALNPKLPYFSLRRPIGSATSSELSKAITVFRSLTMGGSREARQRGSTRDRKNINKKKVTKMTSLLPPHLRRVEVKKNLRSQNLPVQSIRHIQNRFRELFDLVLVSGIAEANDKATKATFYKIQNMCSLSGIKVEQPRKRALPGQCHKC